MSAVVNRDNSHNFLLPLVPEIVELKLMLAWSAGRALVAAVTSGSKRFFLGTDSAPHERQTKEASCGCAGIFSAPIALPLYAEAFEQVRFFTDNIVACYSSSTFSESKRSL